MTSDLLNFSLYSSPKVNAIEIALQKTMMCLKDLIEDYDRISKENMDYKTKFLILEEKCNSESASSEESLKKEIDQKNYMIQHIATALTKLLNTKDFKIIDDIFKIICGDLNLLKIESPQTPGEIIQDQSVSEIEVTPGRRSPIIALSKNKKKSQGLRCTPEKSVKMISSPNQSSGRRYVSKGNGRFRQSRLSVLKLKSSVVVDLTCSPEALQVDDECDIKKELDCKETILPSQTSGPVHLPKYKSVEKESPSKFKKPQSPSKLNIETHSGWNQNSSDTYTQHTIDLMMHSRPNINKSKKQDENVMECDANESVSLLDNKKCKQKSPLAENNNFLNTQTNMESSISLLHRNVRISPPQPISSKRSKLETVVPVYKEPTVRKKSEKRALPGWSCDECKQFYGILYADNPGMLAQKMNECSKHRGINNPIRPSTPKGFWEPRWDVPEDTEEFNRRNDAA